MGHKNRNEQRASKSQAKRTFFQRRARPNPYKRSRQEVENYLAQKDEEPVDGTNPTIHKGR